MLDLLFRWFLLLLQGSIPYSQGGLFRAGTYSTRRPTAAAWLGHDLQGSWKQETASNNIVWMLQNKERHNDLRKKVQWGRGFVISIFSVYCPQQTCKSDSCTVSY